jgi:PAS domain S-box-containing protein
VGIALCVAFITITLNMLVTFNDDLHAFFDTFSGVRIVGLMVNALVVWLAILLWVAYARYRQAQKREEHLDAIITSISPDALLVVRPDRTVELCNGSVERIFGRGSEEIIDHDTEHLYFDRRLDPSKTNEIRDALDRKGFHYGLATGKRKDGSTVPLEIISGDIVGQSGAVLLIRDITERDAIVAEKRRLEERAMRSQKLESLGMMAAGIAHDFNNVLMVIQGHTDLLRMRKSEDEAIGESIVEIRESATKARDLCKQLLSFSGRTPRDVGPMDICSVVHETTRMLTVRIPSNVNVVEALDEQLPTMEGDKTQIHQVAMNLLTNALEAIGARGGTMTVTTQCRECDAHYIEKSTAEGDVGEGRFLVLSVSDTGCGIDDATLQKMWDPFYTTKDTGTGMGMAAVLGITRSHGGFIRVNSKLGEGSTISAHFPAN